MNQKPQASSQTLPRRKLLLGSVTVTATLALSPLALAQTTFRRVPTQYIAALGDPQATSGDNAQQWGLWSKDPGPRGVELDDFEKLKAKGGIAPAQWTFEDGDWWLEEHGLIMEQPLFPLPAGMYKVTGDREKEAILTVHPLDANGRQHWELDSAATIHDVTHLRCRSGRYTPASGAATCSPANAQQSAFPVKPGAAMPDVPGCNRQDYAVFIVYAVADQISTAAL